MYEYVIIILNQVIDVRILLIRVLLKEKNSQNFIFFPYIKTILGRQNREVRRRGREKIRHCDPVQKPQSARLMPVQTS